MDIGVYIEQVCNDLDEIVSQMDVHIEAEYGITVAIDRAISSALIVAELITNAAKYAYQGRSRGKIWVAWRVQRVRACFYRSEMRVPTSR